MDKKILHPARKMTGTRFAVERAIGLSKTGAGTWLDKIRRSPLTERLVPECEEREELDSD
jgi:hypothetical protein